MSIVRRITAIAALATVTALSATAHAASSPVAPSDLAGSAVTTTAPDPNAAKFKQALDSLSTSVEIPGTGFRLLGMRDGSNYLVDLRGRYAVRNPVIEDLWSGATIRTGRELQASRDKIKFENLGLKFNELFSYSYGKGGKTITVFVDPLDIPPTLFKDISRLAKAYAFRVIPIALSEAGYKRAVALKCSARGGEAIQTGAELPAGTCSAELVQRNQVVGKVFGFKSLPAVILSTGDVLPGVTVLSSLPATPAAAPGAR